MFCFRVWNMGCPIEWAYDGDHFWYSDRLVNSAISLSNRADRPRTVGKFSLPPFQILSFALAVEKNASGPLGAPGTKFFDCQGLRVSLTQTLKMRSHLGPHRKRVSVLQTAFFYSFLTYVWL